MKTNIIVRLFHEAVHCWPNCHIKEVEFLKHPHRHVFHIVCKKTVTHEDRDIEFIALKWKIQDYLTNLVGKDMGSWSCEKLAQELVYSFKLNYCEVSEDGENGAEVWA